jgi:hypothetical protein
VNLGVARGLYAPTAVDTGYNLTKAEALVTPFNDPIAESIEEYQSFLKTLGYSPLSKAAYGKNIQ